jgi:hypothetical protein
MKAGIALLFLGLSLSCLSHPCEATKNPPTALTAIDQSYLDAHNKRRKQWHTDNGVSYVPLKWSKSLKRSAKRWAIQLRQEVCVDGGGIYHDPDNQNEGENIAATMGSGSWGKKPPAEKILTRYAEREIGKPGSQKGHLTQAIWRATHYVGCAEASHDHGNGKKCHISVCRYIKPGNCNMGDWSKWKERMLAKDSPCGPACPREGCF